jgi:hypothetical protein
VSRNGINRAGLAVLLPVLRGKETVVADAVAALPNGTKSPFARIGATHFARLILLAAFPARGTGKTLDGVPACLFFGAEFDITVGGYLEALTSLMPEEADVLFGSCAGYPGARVPPLFAKWMNRHRVRAGFSLHANPQARVGQVTHSLRLRARIIRFAVETRALDAGGLKAAWDAQDWEGAA